MCIYTHKYNSIAFNAYRTLHKVKRRDNVIIRKFKETDRPFVLELAKRFNNTNYLPFRDKHLMSKKQEELVYQSVTKNKENVFIAETAGDRLGYLELEVKEDYFTNQKQAYISAIVVAEKSEGKGAARLLINHAEEWASNLGLTHINLEVFSSNTKAIDIYEHLGYQKDIVKMVKTL